MNVQGLNLVPMVVEHSRGERAYDIYRLLRSG